MHRQQKPSAALSRQPLRARKAVSLGVHFLASKTRRPHAGQHALSEPTLAARTKSIAGVTEAPQSSSRGASDEEALKLTS